MHQLEEALVQRHALVGVALELLDAASFGLEVGVELGAEDVLDLRDAVFGLLDGRDEDGAEAGEQFGVAGGEGKP